MFLWVLRQARTSWCGGPGARMKEGLGIWNLLPAPLFPQLYRPFAESEQFFFLPEKRLTRT